MPKTYLKSDHFNGRGSPACLREYGASCPVPFCLRPMLIDVQRSPRFGYDDGDGRAGFSFTLLPTRHIKGVMEM